MEREVLDPGSWRDVAAYVRGLGAECGGLATAIHPADEMYRYERAIPYRSREAAAIGYFATGHQILRTVREIAAWRFGGLAAVREFLDFGSGYGRFTRFLVRELPPRRVTVAEIDPSAVRFQEEAFGVAGIVSDAEPRRVTLDSRFDVVLAGSFFSHLPERSFGPWLGRLRAGLAPGGVLIFSTHGMELLPSEPEAGPRDETAGIVFRPVSETSRLDGADYGTSYVTDAFVREAARGAGEPGDRLLAFPRGLCGLQDLYVLLAPPPPPDRPELRVSRCPLGGCDGSGIEAGVVSVEGWAEGDRGEPAPEVRLFLREALRSPAPGGGAAGTAPEGARRRWRFAFPLSAVEPDDVVRVEARSARGAASNLVIGSMRPYLPAAPV